MVTSPVALCANPLENPVEPLALPLRPASATLALGEELLVEPQYSVPLVLALEYVASHQKELEKNSGRTGL